MWRAAAVAGLVACLLQAASAGPSATGAGDAAGQVRILLKSGPISRGPEISRGPFACAKGPPLSRPCRCHRYARLALTC